MVPGLAPSGRRSASEVISAAREKLSAKPYHVNCRAVAQRLAISAIGIPLRPMARRRLFQRFSGGICLRSKGLTCLETSPGLGSPWVPLSTGEPQSQPHVSKPHITPMPLAESLAAHFHPSLPFQLPQWSLRPLPSSPQRQTHISSCCWQSCERARPGARRRRAWRRKKQRDGRTFRRWCWVAEWSGRGYMRANAVF
jgi:hypothetical protein